MPNLGNTALTILRTIAAAGPTGCTSAEARKPVIPWDKPVCHRTWGQSYFAPRLTTNYFGGPTGHGQASSLFIRGFIQPAGKKGNATLWTLTPAGKAFIGG
jgi:hypothetical protein